MPKSPDFDGSSRLWAKTTYPLSSPSDSTLSEVHSVLHTTYPWTYVQTETELFSCSQVKTEVEDLKDNLREFEKKICEAEESISTLKAEVATLKGEIGDTSGRQADPGNQQ